MTKKLLKVLFYLWITNVIATTINSCTCSCTLVGCVTDTKPFILQFSNDSFKEANLENMSIIRTDKFFNPIDSFRIEQYLNKNDLSIDFFHICSAYPDDIELKDYYYFILNNSINQIDSIWNMNYDVEIVPKVCNTCSGGINCQDEYYDFKEYINPTFKINDRSELGFKILIERK